MYLNVVQPFPRQSYKYTIEFTLDTDAPCTVYVLTSTREDGIR